MWFKKEKKDNYEQLIEEFSKLLIESSDKCTDSIRFLYLSGVMTGEKSSYFTGKEINKEKELNIKKLYLFFFIHFVDRRAFSLLTPDNRKNLMDSLGYKSIEKIIKNNKKQIKNFNKDNLIRQYLKELNSFVLKFDNFKKIVPSEKENPKNTLIWEFSKEISQTIDNSFDIAIINRVSDTTTMAIKKLDIDEVIKKFEPYS